VSNNGLSLFGFPVIITDAVPEGEVVFGPLPTWQEVILHGSLEAAIEAHKAEWVKITNLPTDNK
jgi:hypothetical protein